MFVVLQGFRHRLAAQPIPGRDESIHLLHGEFLAADLGAGEGWGLGEIQLERHRRDA